MNKTGQPVLVGTTSVEKSEYLSSLLQEAGIKHQASPQGCTRVASVVVVVVVAALLLEVIWLQSWCPSSCLSMCVHNLPCARHAHRRCAALQQEQQRPWRGLRCALRLGALAAWASVSQGFGAVGACSLLAL